MASSSRCLRLTAPRLHSTVINPLCPRCTSLLTRTFTSIGNRKKEISKKNPRSNREMPTPKREDSKAEPTPMAKDVEGIPTGQGGLAPGSIFDDELPPSSRTPTSSPISQTAPPTSQPETQSSTTTPQKPKNANTARRNSRRALLRTIRTRARISPQQSIAMRERQQTSKSPFLKTSIKKLGPLARQIAGKPLAEAMVQMRFSKKKAAKDVLKHLELARSQAVVGQKMGLGKGEQGEEELQKRGLEKVGGGGGGGGAGKGEVTVVRDRNGKKRRIEDPSGIYVDQAWVGRGTYGSEIDYRARGRRYMMRKPETSITVLLKEERTRIREAKEREEKKARKKVWVNLPDRPVTAQRQFQLW